MPSDPEFNVFLSHNSKDKPAVRRLANALEARGIRAWLDERELVPGRPWQEALEHILELRDPPQDLRRDRQLAKQIHGVSPTNISKNTHNGTRLHPQGHLMGRR